MIGIFGAIWGLAGFSFVLLYSIFRLTPIALDTFTYDLRWYHWAFLVINTAFMAYFEGYRGFQKGFSPRIAVRAKHIKNHPNVFHVLLSPLYCAGYFHASRRRKIVAYSLTAGIMILVLLIRLLDQPWRGIVDAGVVVGLSWGLISLLIFGVLAFTSKSFDHSPEIPEPRR
jgi:hypothetical protein